MNIDDLTQIIEDKMAGRMSYHASYLKDVEDKRDLAVLLLEVTQSVVTTKGSLVQLCSNIGHTIRRRLELPMDGSLSFRGGLFLFHILGELELVDIVAKKKGKHSQYMIRVLNWKIMQGLWSELSPDEGMYLQPELTMPEDWTESIHPKAGEMIKKASKSLLKSLTPESHPMLFGALNNKQRTGFKVNQRILQVYKELFDKESEVFEHMNPLLSDDQRLGMKMEAQAVLDTANKLEDREFWHLYNFDFRGRIYPLTGYFHEQSSDNAKGLITLSKGVPLGPYGYQWLLIYATNSWGEDKLPLQGRIDYAVDNLEQWFKWALDPIGDQGWTKADKPWAFLSTIIELLSIEFCEDPETFESGLITYIDGTTNGSQHLTALAKDASIAHHVNLVPTEQPGDLYTLIADASYDDISALYDSGMDGKFKEIREQLIELKKPLEKMTNQAEINAHWDKIMEFKDKNADNIVSVAPQFWLQSSVQEKKRKIAKRNVMTLGYGSETKGFSDQLKEDCPKMLDDLKFIENRWTWFMADINFRNCIAKLPGPAAMLQLFKKVAMLSNAQDEKFAWIVPVTNFPAIQTYYEPEFIRLECTWLGKRIVPAISLPEKRRMDKRKQKQAASPNVIHSFDAAHLTMTCLISDFETVTVHDSFGCAAGNMEDLFHIVREEWVKFYEADPLFHLLSQHDALDLMPTLGTLNHKDILDSEFAFS